MRRLFLSVALILMSMMTCGDSAQAATCTPLADGKCTACKNCKYCKHCSQLGGKCSVCKR